MSDFRVMHGFLLFFVGSKVLLHFLPRASDDESSHLLYSQDTLISPRFFIVVARPSLKKCSGKQEGDCALPSIIKSSLWISLRFDIHVLQYCHSQSIVGC